MANATTDSRPSGAASPPAIGPSLTLTPHETVTIRWSTPELIEAEVRYEPGGDRPPPHLHPGQTEVFEVLGGSVSVWVDGDERTYRGGDSFEIPSGAAHRMWNPGDEPARAIWQTRPAGRTREWWEALDALQRTGRVDRNGLPGPLAMGVLLTDYRDVFQLAVRPRPLVRAVLAVLGAVGRRRGY